MTELKTLKDLKQNYIGESHRDGVIDGFKEELKAEAIKWVKENQKKIDNNDWFICKRNTPFPKQKPLEDMYEIWCLEEANEQFKDFFNLTEEDLK